MSELIERVGRALAKEEGYAYDPFPYDERARLAVKAMREHLVQCATRDSEQAYYAAIEEIDAALEEK